MEFPTDGKWVYFNNRSEMEEYYKKVKFTLDFPDYCFVDPGWYYVYTEGRYFRMGATDYYLVFQSALDRVEAVKVAMKDSAEELRVARGKAKEEKPSV